MSTRYGISVTNCSGESGAVELPVDRAWKSWASVANDLLMGRQPRVNIPDAKPGSHVIQVTLTGVAPLELQPTELATVYFLCEHHMSITNEIITVREQA